MGGDSQVTAPAPASHSAALPTSTATSWARAGGTQRQRQPRDAGSCHGCSQRGPQAPAWLQPNSQASSCTHLLPCHNLSAGPAVQGCPPALRGGAACPCAHPVVQEHRSQPQKLQDPLLQSHAAWGYA